jgi:hypothetical protein
MTTTTDVLVELDDRGRLSLGKPLTAGRRRYSAHVEATGVIVLTPVVVLTETEAALLARPDLQALVAESDDPRNWVARGWRPSHNDQG